MKKFQVKFIALAMMVWFGGVSVAQPEGWDNEDYNPKWTPRHEYGAYDMAKYATYKANHIGGACAYVSCKYPGVPFNQDTFTGQPKDFTVDHKISVKKHWSSSGSSKTSTARNQWFNDTTNWQPMHHSCNASKGD